MKLPPEVQKIVSAEAEQKVLDEHVSKKLLRACGLPTVEKTVVSSIEQAQKKAIELEYPVVMKGLLPDAVHKTEMDLVHLGISNASLVSRYYKKLTSRMRSKCQVLLQKQVQGTAESIVGLIRDPQFGPCVMFGLGGISPELFEDIVFGIAPLTFKEALEMIGRIKAQKMLDGFRQEAPVDRKEIAKILVRVGEIGLNLPQIQEIDINPLISTQKGAVVVDASIILLS